MPKNYVYIDERKLIGMADCIFCAIVRGDIPGKKVYEDEKTLAFDDINPQAPVHVVVVPKRHVSGMNALDELPAEEQAALLHACREAARLKGIDQSGYRVITNCGADACQSVQHLHLHVLGGVKMSEQMA